MSYKVTFLEDYLPLLNVANTWLNVLSTYLGFKLFSSFTVYSAVCVCNSMVLSSFHLKPLEDRDPSVCMAHRARPRCAG